MSHILSYVLSVIQILFLNLLLSGDNVGVIALATRNLPRNYARKASAIGITAAILLKIAFSAIILLAFDILWLPIKLTGGILLIKITWDFIKPQKQEEGTKIKQSGKFWNAIISIIIADITMSLDNVLAVASAAKGDMLLLISGLVLSIPVYFYGSQFVMGLMQKHLIAIYIGGAVLAHTSFNMLLEDRLIAGYISRVFSISVPYIMAAVVLIYGIYMIRKNKKVETAIRKAEMNKLQGQAQDCCGDDSIKKVPAM